MKKVLSFFLAAVLLLSLFVLPLSAQAKKQAAAPTKVTGLKITTANKEKQLKLTWKAQKQADGYQVYRSATGKSGSYQKIATVRGKNAYIDKGLKSATTYYYAVRAFAKQDGKTVFGGFSKANLSTRINATYAKKRFNATVRFLESFYSSGTNFNEMILRPRTDQYGTYDDTYYLFQYKNCSTKAQLKKHLTKYVSSKVADAILEEKFVVINKKLYIWFPVMGAESGMVLSKTKISDFKTSDKKSSMRIGVLWRSFADERSDYYHDIDQTLVYENGRWVFGKLNYLMEWMYPYL